MKEPPLAILKVLTMDYFVETTVLVVGSFFSILLLQDIGRRIRLRRLARDPAGAQAGVGAVASELPSA
ncbi:MAG TPA: hypothetical protein VLK82_25870 [Candidatus Tectomicrobia bacterium]|nr:hypothetical protein [Candidatus Tectomicrobia bacterium]